MSDGTNLDFSLGMIGLMISAILGAGLGHEGGTVLVCLSPIFTGSTAKSQQADCPTDLR